MRERTYTDADLQDAVSGSTSWRSVLRALGLASTSAGSIRSVQRRAAQLGLSSAHFTGRRRWTDAQLRDAVARSSNWVHVACAVGLAPGGGAQTALHAHAVRLGIDTGHLATERPRPPLPAGGLRPDPAYLRDAGSLLAAAWFALRGATILWPLEPCRYDLVADINGVLERVQVKTTVAHGAGAVATISNSRRHGHVVYGPDEIDAFFVIDSSLDAYLIPYDVVAGLTALRLSRYEHFKVAERGALLSVPASP